MNLWTGLPMDDKDVNETIKWWMKDDELVRSNPTDAQVQLSEE